MSTVSLKNATKTFGAATAVDDLSLTIGDGEFVVLLGPTGAGKTTCLRLIAGLESPDAGRVEINAVDVTRLPPVGRDVAFVFQQYSLYPHYTVFDNMAFPLRAPGRKLSPQQIKKRVNEVAEMLRIETKLQNRATELSGGEMQRVAIGRALVREPQIFLMDEPLSSLDVKLREDLRIELKRIQRELQATILYVTHDQLEALSMADRIAVLHEGRLVQFDTPREIYENPQTIYAAQRLGSPQINLMPVNGAAPATAQTAAVRPEDIMLGIKDGIPATVISVEHLGVETVLQLESNGQRLQAYLGAHQPLGVGDKTHYSVSADKFIYFNKQGGLVARGKISA